MPNIINNPHAASAEDIETRPEQVRISGTIKVMSGYRWRTEDDADDSPSPIVSRDEEPVGPEEYVAVIEVGEHRMAVTAENLVRADIEFLPGEEENAN